MFLPVAFVPQANSDAVKKLRRVIGTDRDPVQVPVMAGPQERDRNCYVNVRERITRDGGRMQLGWAVWQHSHLFIEAEPHAVIDPGHGQQWIDCTPHVLEDGNAVRQILFIPNDETYDFETTDVQDNVRVPLIEDARLSKALELLSEQTALWNSVPGIDVHLPQDVARKVMSVELQAGRLFAN